MPEEERRPETPQDPSEEDSLGEPLDVPVFFEEEPQLPPSDSSDSEEEDDFEDAMDESDEENDGDAMDLITALVQCEEALDRFLNNDVVGAMNLMRPWKKTSLYHSLAHSVFMFIPAVLLLTEDRVASALVSVKRTLELCQNKRRAASLVETFGLFIRKPNYRVWTEMEAHAELCHAEALLIRAALAVLSEDFSGLVRAAYYIKISHTTYKNCERILHQRTWESERSRRDFTSGVRLGLATFTVVVSMLPPRLVALLSFAGFSGNRAQGLAALQRGAAEGGLRAPLCDLMVLFTQLVLQHFAAMDLDSARIEHILAERLQVAQAITSYALHQQYPEGAFFLVFLGRLQLLRGQAGAARATLARVASVPRLWPQLQHLTYWECMWAHSVELRWREAAQCAARLLAESAWSRTVYAYTQAAFLLQLPDLDIDERLLVARLLESAVTYRQRIAGKSLPMEKFVVRRCTRRVALPGLELLCLWNMFPALAADEARVSSVMQVIDTLEREAFQQPGGSADEMAHLWYLRGSLQAAGGHTREARESLRRLIEFREILAIVWPEMPMRAPWPMLNARAWVERVRCDLPRVLPNRLPSELSGYPPEHRLWNQTNFFLESRLQFRVQARLAVVAELPEEA